MPRLSTAQWCQFYKVHARRAKYFALKRYCKGNEDDADELVSDAFAKAIASPGPDDVAQVAAWFYRILYNLAVDWARRAGRRPGVVGNRSGTNDDDPIEALPAREIGPDAECVAKEDKDERLQHLEQAMARLSDDAYTAIYLFCIAEMSSKDVAVVIGRTDDATRKLLTRARAKLREGFEQ